MNISIIGTGRWGSFIAWYIKRIGHNITICGEENAPDFIELRDTRSNSVVSFPEDVEITSNLERALKSEIIIISVPSQALRSLMSRIKEASPRDKTFVLCMKGIEIIFK